MPSSALFTSASDKWRTPRALYQALDAEFHFDFDPCPADPKFDGLDPNLHWGRCNFVNPPYGPQIKVWIKKAALLRDGGDTTVLLLPARTDTIWFHEYALKADEIRFIQGRLCFGDDKRKRATFPSMIVVFRGVEIGRLK